MSLPLLFSPVLSLSVEADNVWSSGDCPPGLVHMFPLRPLDLRAKV